MEEITYCSKCAASHERPVGRRCILEAAMTSVQSVNTTNVQVQSSSFTVPTSSVAVTQAQLSTETLKVAKPGPSSENVTNVDILKVLNSISARITVLEENHGRSRLDTITSTPRKAKKRGQKAKTTQNAPSRLAISQTLDESDISMEQPIGASVHQAIPLSVPTTTVTRPVVSVITTSAQMASAVQVVAATAVNAVPVSVLSPILTQTRTTGMSPVHNVPLQQPVQINSQGAGLPQVPVPPCSSASQMVNSMHVTHSNTPQLSGGLMSQQVQFANPSTTVSASLTPVMSTNFHYAQSQNVPYTLQMQNVLPQVVGNVPIQHPVMTPQINQGMTGSQPGMLMGAQAFQPQSSPQDANVVPSLGVPRNSVDQQTIQNRLDEFRQGAFSTPHGESHCCHADSSKKKKVQIAWPQDHVFVGIYRRKVTYEQLTMEQFTLGFLKTVELERNQVIRANMVTYLTNLFQNVCDYGWQQVKGAHHVVLSCMEDGILTWLDLKKCNKTRKANLISKTSPKTSNSPPKGSKSGKNPKIGSQTKKVFIVPCTEYQTNECDRTGDHVSGSVTHKHACSYCLYTQKRWYNHGKFECTNKAKNGPKV